MLKVKNCLDVYSRHSGRHGSDVVVVSTTGAVVVSISDVVVPSVTVVDNSSDVVLVWNVVVALAGGVVDVGDGVDFGIHIQHSPFGIADVAFSTTTRSSSSLH